MQHYHYFCTCDTKCLNDICTMKKYSNCTPRQKQHVSVAHRNITKLTLSKMRSTVKILPQLRSASLIFIWKLCDDGCKVYFDESKINIHENNQLIIRGIRNEKMDFTIYQSQR